MSSAPRLWFVLVLSGASCWAGAARADRVVMTIDAGNRSDPVTPYEYGMFIEPIGGLKNRASSISLAGVPKLSIAVDTYFPRARLIDCLHALERESPTAAISLRMTTMQGGELLVLAGDCSLAVSVAEVAEVKKSAIERHWLGEMPLVTVCAPTHPLASIDRPISLEEFRQHVQVVVTDNQPGAEKNQKGIAGERQWLVNDLGAKRDLLLAGLSWGHMPVGLVAADLAEGRLVELRRRAWHLRPLVFVISRMRGSELSLFEQRAVQFLADPPGSRSDE